MRSHLALLHHGLDQLPVQSKFIELLRLKLDKNSITFQSLQK